ncbi:MAG: hypothetical protein NT154_27445, partial [Verrucomicrobia bacterium]|nr:hypothetical protein [Verrucomicrobiota bacterium]
MKRPWYMRQRPALVLVAGLGGLFAVVHVPYAQPWATTMAPIQPWKSVAASADGSKLVAAGCVYWGSYSSQSPRPIYRSIDAGLTWVQTGAPSNNWASVASSADGAKLVAVASGVPFLPGDGF